MRSIVFLMVLFTLSGVLQHSRAQEQSLLTSLKIHQILSTIQRDTILKPKQENHPDYPTLSVLSALREDLNQNPKQVINELEFLLQKKKFDGVIQSGIQVDTVGSYSLWRETAYLLLGRAYYEIAQYERAIYFYKGIPVDSPFASVAEAELGWAYLQRGLINETQSLINQNKKEGSSLWIEQLLQQAYVYMKKEEHIKCVELIENLKIPTQHAWLETVRLKTLAQSSFKIFLDKKSTSSFNKNKERIESVLNIAERVPAFQRDAKFSFLTGEAYWHLASLYRIENPEKFKKQASEALAQAERWLSPWYEKTIQAKKALMEEEAFFFSAVVLWEQERQQEAVDRLRLLPTFYPLGEYREDVYQLAGDLAFERKDFKKALQNYTELVKIGGDEKATYGLFKAAWAFYNIRQPKKAITHMRRLVAFYRHNKKTELENEASRDLILFLAENTRYSQALNELEPLAFKQEEWPEIKEKLAETYVQIGRYGEATTAYQDLLDQQKASTHSLRWLHSLSLAYLSMGDRSEIPKKTDLYLSKIIENTSLKGTPEYIEYQKNFTSLTLTLHRESRKTDDPLLWKSTDGMYDVFFKYFPESLLGAVWYHGAQRKEHLAKYSESIQWYKRAAVVTDYENKDDSLHSILRISKNLLDQESIKSKPNIDLYSQLAQDTEWYIQKFPLEKERDVADVLYTEALHKSQKLQHTHDYIIQRIKELSSNAHAQSLFMFENNRLYRAKNWIPTYEFSGRAIKITSDEDEAFDFRRKLNLIHQEAAFQKAYELEKEIEKNKSTSPSSMREWYRKTVLVENADPSVTLKAWHNLLVSFNVPQEMDLLTSELKNFKPYYQARMQTQFNPKDNSLFEMTWLKISDAYKKQNRLYEYAKALTFASDHVSDTTKQSQMRWEALGIMGSYYDLEAMDTLKAKLEQDQNFDLTSPQKRLILARLYLMNNEGDSAWKLIQDFTKNSKEENPLVWLMISDLMTLKNIDFDSHDELQEWLKENYPHLKEQPVLYSSWADVFEKTPLDSNSIDDKIPGRSPASTSSAALDNPQEQVQELKSRLSQVTESLNWMSQSKTTLQPEFQNPVIQRRIEVACHIPIITDQTTAKLEALKTPTLSLQEWPMFVQKLDEKTAELKKTKQQEQSVCDQAKMQAAFLPPVGKKSFCPSAFCAKPDVWSPSKIDDLEKSWSSDPHFTRTERVVRYLKLGALGPAQFWAEAAESAEERSFLLGLVRLGYQDSWNAAALLEESQKSQAWRTPAALVRSSIAREYELPSIADREKKNVQDSKNLPDWIKPIAD